MSWQKNGILGESISEICILPSENPSSTATKWKVTVKFNKTLQQNNYLLSGKKNPNQTKSKKKNHSEAVMTVQICDSRKKSYEATENWLILPPPARISNGSFHSSIDVV